MKIYFFLKIWNNTFYEHLLKSFAQVNKNISQIHLESGATITVFIEMQDIHNLVQ
jgi:hypothetical protein